jgi:disulfide bond formation protein DsbB
MNEIKTKHLLFAVPAYAAALIAAALISQYGFEMLPCKLCLMQRIPYIIVIILGILALLIKKLRPLLLILCTLAYLADAGIATYHVGVEKHLWVMEEECSSTLDGASADDLLKQLLNAPAKRCDEPQFVFLNVSMAGWNILAALAGAALSAYTFIRLKNAKAG